MDLFCNSLKFPENALEFHQNVAHVCKSAKVTFCDFFIFEKVENHSLFAKAFREGKLLMFGHAPSGPNAPSR